MAIKNQLIRGMLKLATWRLPIFEAGDKKAPIQISEGRFRVFSGFPEDLNLQGGLAKAYGQVFSEPPWEERWPAEAVLAKLKRELTAEAFLVLMNGNEQWPVVGFSWGAILPIEALELRVGASLGTKPVGLEKKLRTRGVEQILYFDEFAILRQFRSGLEPLRWLTRLALELGWKQGVHQALFWSTPESKIVPLTLYMGYEPLFLLEAEGKKIVFLYNADFLPLLKILQNMELRPWVRLMKTSSRILGRHHKAGK